MTGTVQSERATFAFHSWILYGFLILLRVCAAPFLPGYVHPDEFFQGGQELWFGCPPAAPWEFEPENALRSVVPPMIMTLWPLQVYAYFSNLPVEQLSGLQVWIIPRVACAMASIFAVDCSVWAISKATSPPTQRSGVPLSVLLAASAWPTLVLLNRPFSNAMETWILSLLLRTALQETSKTKKTATSISILQCLLFGILSALGIFTRFTFVCFAFPIVLYFGFRMLQTLRSWDWFIKPTMTCAAFLLFAKLIIEMDSRFYSTRNVESVGREGVTYITPWNAFSYNSRVENLEEHGLHPRWTHAVVNMFILYGPMALASYSFLVMSLWWTFQNRRTSVGETVFGSDGKHKMAIVLYQSILVCGLGLLSSAPHQEPRFLLPLITPLVLLVANQRIHSLIPILPIWIVFNTLLLVIFGVMHQGGVINSLLALGSILMEGKADSVIFYHTYMPPTFLSRTRTPPATCHNSNYGDRSCLPSETTCRDISLLDLDGSHNLFSLGQTLQNALRCDEEENHSTSRNYGHVYLVANPLREFIEEEEWYLGRESCTIPGMKCEILWTYAPHLATEDLPSIANLQKEGLPLSLYEISCA